ncbi:MAG TPA: hypothetical protein DIW23_08705 [Anaerolineae bacterium]|nr:hypothetical protein [Anaerolineae bacterium]
MSFSQALEVVIGLIFVFYVLGSIVSLITQWINEAFETRGKSLEKHLKKIVGDNHVGDFVKLPQIQSLRPIRYKNWYSFVSSNTEQKMVEKIPVATLVDSYFDFVGLTASKEITGEGLKELISAFPDSEGKRAIAKWVGQGVTDLEELRKRTTAYFGGLMEQAAATFRSNSRSFVIVLSMLLTLFLGTDSIQLAQTLWANAGIRSAVVAQAQMEVQMQAVEGTVSEDRIDDLIQQLIDLDIVKIGWWQTDVPPAGSDINTWATFIVLKILGLGLTVMAVSQGSSFWYDLLKKLVSKGGSSSSGDGEAKG